MVGPTHLTPIMTDLPEKYKPAGATASPVVVADLDPADPVPTSAEFDLAMAKLGYSHIKCTTVKAMKTVGLTLKAEGVIHTARGGLYASFEELSVVAQTLREQIERDAKTKTKRHLPKLAMAMASIVRGKTEVMRLLHEMEPRKVEYVHQEEERRVTSSFGTGEITPPSSGTIVMAKEVHMHQNEKKAE